MQTKEFELFPYQKAGAEWLSPRRYALLADEMGLGKSAQVIEAACRLQDVRTVLVICPLIAKANWVGEVEKFAWRSFDLTTVTYQSAFVPRAKTNAELTVNPALLRPWDIVVLDECHYAVNAGAQTTQAVYGHIAQYGRRLWAVSGTPARNHNGDMYPFLKAIRVFQGTRAQFEDRFCRFRYTKYGPKIIGSQNTQELRAMLAPYILRRRKAEVMPQLPPLTYSEMIVEPTPVDIDLWYPEVDTGAARWETLKGQIDEQNAAIAQIVKVAGHSEDLLGAMAAIKSRVSAGRRYTGIQKAPGVADIIEAELDAGMYEKIVLFGYHGQVLDILFRRLKRFDPVRVWGKTSGKDRAACEHRFQNRKSCRVFVGQIQAAGVAISLTAAHELGFVEYSWVPADNAQCVMRIHRIGATRPCRARFFTMAGEDGASDRVMCATVRRKTRDLTELFDSVATNPFD